MWRDMINELKKENEHVRLKDGNLRFMLVVCEQETELSELQEVHQDLVTMPYERATKAKGDKSSKTKAQYACWFAGRSIVGVSFLWLARCECRGGDTKANARDKKANEVQR